MNAIIIVVIILTCFLPSPLSLSPPPEMSHRDTMSAYDQWGRLLDPETGHPMDAAAAAVPPAMALSQGALPDLQMSESGTGVQAAAAAAAAAAAGRPVLAQSGGAAWFNGNDIVGLLE